MQLVLVTEYQHALVEFVIAVHGRPLDADGRVVPHEAALVVGMVRVVALSSITHSVNSNNYAVLIIRYLFFILFCFLYFPTVLNRIRSIDIQ